MTDARFPERWLNDRRIMRLPADAFRLFVVSLAWSVANRTDGYLYQDDLQAIPGATSQLAQQLNEAGLWLRLFDPRDITNVRVVWLIDEFEETQTTRADLEALDAARKKARDKKRRQRAGAAPDVPRDVPRDSTRTGQDRTGSPLTEGQGQDLTAPFPSPQTGDGSNNGASQAQHIRISASAGAKVTTVTRARPGRPSIPDDIIGEIRELHSHGHSISEIARRTGKSKGLVHKYIHVAAP